MNLRNDPDASSAMAGVLTQSNSFKLTGMIGRRPTESELYMAHFMGVGGAAKLITNAEDNPQASGARLFPNAAAANRSIFYDHSGRARSISEVYSVLTARYAGAASSPATQRRDGLGGRHVGGHERCGGSARRQCRLPVELSGRAIGRSGHVGLGLDADQRAGTGRSGLPLAVPVRRTRSSRFRLPFMNCGAIRPH